MLEFDRTRTPRDYKAEADMKYQVYEEFAENPFFWAAFWPQMVVDNFGYAKIILEEFYAGFT